MPWSPAPVDVGTLLVEGREDAASLAVELEGRAVIADIAYHLACHVHKVDVGAALDLARYDDLSRGDKSLAGDLARRVAGKELVEYGV